MTLQYPLSDASIDSFNEQLQNEDYGDTYDYFGCHGFLTALAIGPEPIPPEHWVPVLLDLPAELVEKWDRLPIYPLLQQLEKAIAAEIDQENRLRLPCRLQLTEPLDEAPLSDWCVGFIEGMLLNEEAWYEQNEEEVAHLLLPILFASGLYEEEEFTTLRQDAALTRQICEQIPEVVIDLFLFFHAPNG